MLNTEQLQELLLGVIDRLRESRGISPDLDIRQRADGLLELSYRGDLLSSLEHEQEGEEPELSDLAYLLLEDAEILEQIFQIKLSSFEEEQLPALELEIRSQLQEEGLDPQILEELSFYIEEIGYESQYRGRYMDQEAEWGYPRAALRITDGGEIDVQTTLDLDDPLEPLEDRELLLLICPQKMDVSCPDSQ